VPVLRSVVSLPAGMTRMPLVKFTVLTSIGTGVWNAAFIAAGWFLAEKWQEVDHYMGPVSFVVIGLIVVGLAVLAWRRSREKVNA
jgi:membrane protein DedA with SNARE-associated domain